jgi:hypothetical protein
MTESEVASATEVQWSAWIHANMGELFSDHERQVFRSSVSSALRRLVDQVTGGDISAFARLIDVPVPGLLKWQRGDSLPLFEKLLRIGHSFGIPLVRLLHEQFSVGGTDLARTVGTHRRNTYRKFDAAAVTQLLERTRADSGGVPQSLTRFAREHGYARGGLRQHLPKQCGLLAQRHQDFQRARRAAVEGDLADRVRQAAHSLIGRGLVPTPTRLASELDEKPGIFLNPAVRAVVRELRAQANLSNRARGS